MDFADNLHGEVTHSLASSSSSPATKAAADDTLADLHPPAPLPLLVRATDGKSKEHRKQKVKLSTVVQPTDIDTFFTRYAEVCKGGMTALRKRDRSGRKKAKAKKKKTTTTTTTTSATAAASGAATTAGSTGGVAGGSVRRKGER